MLKLLQYKLINKNKNKNKNNNDSQKPLEPIETQKYFSNEFDEDEDDEYDWKSGQKL